MSTTHEYMLMAGIVKRTRVFGETVSTIAKRHSKVRSYGQRPVPIFLRFDKASYSVDLVCKVREHLALPQIGQFTETFVLHSASQMQDLLL